MEIRIHLRHPWVTLALIIVVVLWWNGVLTFHWGSNEDPEATGGLPASLVMANAVEDIQREKVKQAVLEKREEILRYQLQILEHEALAAKDPASVQRAAEAQAVLLSIVKQRTTSEKLLILSLEQLWEAEGSAYTLRGIDIDTKLLWPVSPRLGISAHFEDEGYKKRFGFAHHAIDIPVSQGTAIQAPANATVVKVALNGLGYSYVVLEHAGGVQTIYGHISASLVKEGDAVAAGDEFALTGGTPGSEGAGLMTTGPHLHFAVKAKGVLVDPMKYLPKL